MSLARTRWHQLSVFLLNPSRSERGCLVPDVAALRPQAQELLSALNKLLASFINKKNAHYQQRHPQDVALECAKFGCVVLSQPAEYVYRFSSSREELVVCPGLDKVSDDLGARYAREIVVEADVYTL